MTAPISRCAFCNNSPGDLKPTPDEVLVRCRVTWAEWRRAHLLLTGS